MRVKLEVVFEVEAVDGGELTKYMAWTAADLAYWHNLVLISASGRETETVTQHVDGRGKCLVTLVNPTELG